MSTGSGGLWGDWWRRFRDRLTLGEGSGSEPWIGVMGGRIERLIGEMGWRGIVIVEGVLRRRICFSVGTDYSKGLIVERRARLETGGTPQTDLGV